MAGIATVILDRLGAIDRRVEDMSRSFHRRLDRYEEQVGEDIKEVRERHENHVADKERKLDKQDERISDVERGLNMVKGGMIVLGIVATPLAAEVVRNWFS